MFSEKKSNKVRKVEKGIYEFYIKMNKFPLKKLFFFASCAFLLAFCYF